MMENIRIKSTKNLQSLMGDFAEMPLYDLEYFSNGILILSLIFSHCK